MPAERPLKVVLCWHMHQPEYRDLVSGEYQLPWTYLHAIKDYADMAAHLEAVPGMRAVVNFAPVLLEQLRDYDAQLQAYLRDGGPIRDPLLAALDEPALPVRPEERLALVKACLRANRRHMIEAYPRYRLLAEMADWMGERQGPVAYLSEEYLADLLVWYHLAWLGETVRREDPRVARLMAKGGHFTLHERRELLEVIAELIGGLLGRYRRLAEGGRVELAMSPYGHPMLPLLLDLEAAREAQPKIQLPLLRPYPGGEERARWHLEEGLRVFEACFGHRPAGCWPSEGGLSEATLRLLGEHGFRWTATGESVLAHSLDAAGQAREGRGWLFRPYRLEGSGAVPACFFRDDGLSDLIGFSYADWRADDAVADLVGHLENIARQVAGDPQAVVSIILDGENAWEHYPYNGYFFLRQLYERLAEHPGLEPTTFADCLDQGLAPRPLPRLVAGSWVYGTFSTWIGDPDKNRGWELLGRAKEAFDRARASGYLAGPALAAAERQLAACEGSDWCWWFGDYNPAETVSDFDRLYRMHLGNLYHLVGEEPPEELAHHVSHGADGGPGAGPEAAERGGTMRRGQAQG